MPGREQSVQLGKYARLTRAPDEIRAWLSHMLEPHSRTLYLQRRNPWESERVDGVAGAEIRRVDDPSKHQYWVVQHWRRMFDPSLEHALELADPGLTPLISLTRPHPLASGYADAHAILNWIEENHVTETRVVGPSECQSLERGWQSLIEFEANDDPSYRFITQAMRDFSDLKRIPVQMPIYVVGLFAIIEMLLTTPQEKTTLNSLSHQLKEKLTLLGHRFAEPLVAKDYLPQTSEMDFKSVVTKLYSYRSKVAHGSEPDFNKDLKVLEGHKTVCRLLRAVVRKLIMQAVYEPVLFHDLKSC